MHYLQYILYIHADIRSQQFGCVRQWGVLPGLINRHIFGYHIKDKPIDIGVLGHRDPQIIC